MRFFAGDHFPRLAVQSGDLPRPWVMPLGLPRGHRDRLAALLGQALRALEPGLTMVQLRWAERIYLRSGRLMLPSTVLVWWRVNAVPVVDPQAVVIEGSKLTPGLSLYDFDPPLGLAAEAWLGPLKMAVLRRIQDRLFDERPVARYEDIADAIGDLAAKLVSPVDIIVATEAMVELEAQGDAGEMARAEAVGRVIAARIQRPTPALVRPLLACGEGSVLDDDALKLLQDVGLADRGGVDPVLDLLREEEALRRALAWIARRGQFIGSLGELAPRLFPKERTQAALVRGTMAALPALVETTPRVLEIPEAEDALVRDARKLFMTGNTEESTRALLQALQRRDDSRWSEKDALCGGIILFRAGMSADAARGQNLETAALDRAATIYEASAELLARGKSPIATSAFLRAAWTHNVAYRWQRAAALHERARDLAIASGNKSELASSLWGLAEMRLRLGDLSPAHRDANDSANLFRELHLDAQRSGSLRILGDIYARWGLLDQAQEAANKSLDLADISRNPYTRVAALLTLSRIHALRNDFKVARERLETALAVCKDTQHKPLEAQVHQALGELSLQRGEPLRAREAFEEVAEIYHELGESRGEAAALQGLGDARLGTGEVALARDAYSTSLALARTLQDARWEAWLLLKRGSASEQVDDLDAARQDCEDALHAYETVGDAAGEALACEQLGHLERRAGDWSASARWYTRTVDYLRKARDIYHLPLVLAQLADTLTNAGRQAEALASATEALNVARETGEEDLIGTAEHTLNHIASLPSAGTDAPALTASAG